MNLRSVLNRFRENWLLSANHNLEQLKNTLRSLAFGQGIHGGLNQIESLLKIIETYGWVDPTPVDETGFEVRTWNKFAIYFFIEEDVEDLFEDNAVGEFWSEGSYRWVVSFSKDFVNKFFQFIFIHFYLLFYFLQSSYLFLTDFKIKLKFLIKLK